MEHGTKAEYWNKTVRRKNILMYSQFMGKQMKWLTMTTVTIYFLVFRINTYLSSFTVFYC